MKPRKRTHSATNTPRTLDELLGPPVTDPDLVGKSTGPTYEKWKYWIENQPQTARLIMWLTPFKAPPDLLAKLPDGEIWASPLSPRPSDGSLPRA
jgi:hypothetical protein